MAFLGLISWSLFVDACRLLSICMFLLCSLTFNWYSFFSIIFMLGEVATGEPARTCIMTMQWP